MSLPQTRTSIAHALRFEYPPGVVPLGSRIQNEQQENVFVAEDVFATHMAVYGGTGQGKSKFLENVLRFLLLNHAGFCLIDPHGDLSEDVLAFIDRMGDHLCRPMRQNLFYLEPGHSQFSFSFDPFQYRDGDGDYEIWLHQKVHWAAKAIIRMQGEPDFQGMNRLERWMKNILTAVAVRIDEQGTHLPLSDALLLLEPDSPTKWDTVFERIRSHLPSAVRANFEALRRGTRKVREEVESTENRLRSFLSPRVQSIFSCQAPSVDLRHIVRVGGLLIVNLKGLIPEEANAIGGVIINDLFATVSQVAKPDRRRFYVFIDEATRFVGDDLIKGFGEARKWLLSICLAVQDLSSLRTNKIDMTPRVNSQCGVKISFQQQNPEDLEVLGRMYAYKDLDRTRRIIEVDRFAGHKKVVLHGSNHESSSGSQRGDSSGTSDVFGDLARQRQNRSSSQGETESSSEGSSTRETLIPEYQTEERDEGLKFAIEEQIAYRMADLAELDHREAIVAVGKEKPFQIYTPTVSDVWNSVNEKTRYKLIESFKLKLFAEQECFFKHEDSLGEDARIQRFLNAPGDTADGHNVKRLSDTQSQPKLDTTFDKTKSSDDDDLDNPWGI